jgi:hypothetical protein
MKSPVRRLAYAILNTVVEHSSAESQTWGTAMLHEFALVEDDWHALFWALGSSMALCRHSVPLQLQAACKRMVRSTPGMLAGVAAAVGVLAICVAASVSMLNSSWFPSIPEKLARLLVIMLPEIFYVAGIVILWRRRKPLAVGILLTGIAVMSHAIVHFAVHG